MAGLNISFVTFDEFRVLNRGVDAGTGMLYFGDEYIKAIFYGTQLFEFFQFFQRRLRQFCNLQQEIFPISVYADMTQIILCFTYTALLAVVWYDGTGEINCYIAISFEF